MRVSVYRYFLSLTSIHGDQ